MRLLFLLPSFALLAISGYNFFDTAALEQPNYLALKVLHLLVMIISLFLVFSIIRPLFVVRSKKATHNNRLTTEEGYEELNLQHS